MLFFDHKSSDNRIQSQIAVQLADTARRDLVEYLSKPVAERLQTDVPEIWKVRLQPFVVEALKELSYGKCSFCEAKRKDLAPFRFRPPAYIRPTSHPEDKWRYLWLTFSWQNLFPICQDCWPRDPAIFPVRGRRLRLDELSDEALEDPRPSQGGTEKPMLLFPGEEKVPARSFDVTLTGYLSGKTARAKLTIEQYRLNRDTLPLERGRAIADVLKHLSSNDPPSFEIDFFARAQFGGAIYLAVRKVASVLAPKYGRKSTLTPVRILSVLANWSRRSRFREDFEQAIETLHSLEARDGHSKADIDEGPFDRDDPAWGRLRHLSVRNFRSLESVELSLPAARTGSSAPCMMILGENATGKSSLLQAIVAACLSASDLSRLKLGHANSVYDPQLMGARADRRSRAITVALDFELGERELIIEPRGVDIRGGRAPAVFAYGPSRYYDDTERRTKLRHVDTLFFPHEKISNPVRWLARLARRSPDVLDEVVSALRHVIQIEGEFSHIEVSQSDSGATSDCHIHVKKTRRDGTFFTVRQSLGAASSGYRAILALVCDLFAGLIATAEKEGVPPTMLAREARMRVAIVVIDEVEAHLHPRWKLGVITGLRAAFPNIMFVMTSHDPLCVRGMRAGETVLLNRYQTEDFYRPEAVEAVALEDDFDQMTIEQLLTSDLFSLFSTDDAGIDRTFAEMSVLLARRENLQGEEEQAFHLFEKQLLEALPYGTTEVSRLVNEAVAEYVNLRRVADVETVSEAREKAKEEVKRFLRGLAE